MNTFCTRAMKLGLSALALGVCMATFGQAPVITSFSQNGLLVCSNLAPGSVASVEWASSASGPWTNNWAGLDAVTVASNGSIQVSVPMFYRVRGVPNTPSGMGLIPAGTFTIGNSTGDGDISDAIPTNVTVSAFYIDTNLVSSSQWLAVYSFATNNGYGFVNVGSGKAPNHPVQKIDWFDAVKWCNARSQQAGLPPVYYTDPDFTQVYTNGDNGTTVYPNWSANGYRLPTEAEWEKAARGGLSGQRFPWGNTLSESQANYWGDTVDYSYDLGPNGFNPIGNFPATTPGTSPVGSFAANGYGLCDMAGNVFEWCWDWYATPYAGGTDPRGPVGQLTNRVLRGGNWVSYANDARCAFRYKDYPFSAYNDTGFRCAKGL